jgi:hypothetical protein
MLFIVAAIFPSAVDIFAIRAVIVVAAVLLLFREQEISRWVA